MLHTFLSRRALQAPEKIAVIQGQRRVTYGELDYQASQLASFLIKNKNQKGDRVGIYSANSPEYISSFFGILKAGSIAVDINYQYSAHEIKKILNHCSVSQLIVDNRFMETAIDAIIDTPSLKTIIGIERRSRGSSSYSEAVRRKLPSHINYVVLKDVVNAEHGDSQFPAIDAQDIASIVYTSGTTGESKGVMLSHDNLVANAESIISYLHLTEDDSAMVVLPFCYSYGKSLLTTHMMAGGTVVLENSFMYPTQVFNKMVEEEVTGFAGVPSTFGIILTRSNVRNYRFPKLRYMTQAGGPMSPLHTQKLSRVFPDTQIYIMYGQTEATARLTYLNPRYLSQKPGSIGKPIPGVEIELIKDNGIPAVRGEEGEIVVKGRNVMVGYWNSPEETKKVLKAGRLHTGDIAKMDEEGYLYIVGRRSDMIKSGAHRISPKEIEEVIHEISEVYEAAVVGIPDEILGEAVKAVIVLKDGHSIDARKVQQHCQTKLAPFKIPKVVVFARELPRTISGKVVRYLLKDQELRCMPDSLR